MPYSNTFTGMITVEAYDEVEETELMSGLEFAMHF